MKLESYRGKYQSNLGNARELQIFQGIPMPLNDPNFRLDYARNYAIG